MVCKKGVFAIPVKPNGTDAKEIAVHFINLTETRATPQIMAKTINQAKSLLESNYTKEEVLSVLDYVILEKKIDVYSLGYVNSCINDVLREIKALQQEKEKQEAKEQFRKESASIQTSQQSEVKEDDESTERNRQKAERQRSHIQSRLGEKFDFDLFKR